MTHRQFLAWLEWEQEDLSTPGKIEYYLAQAACEVRRVLASKPDSVKVGDFVLKFIDTSKPLDGDDQKNATAMTQAVWKSRMTLPVTIVKPEEVKWVYPPNYKPPTKFPTSAPNPAGE
jgi:hypothetical protein